VNCWRRASADRTAMSRWLRLAVPITHSLVLICVGTRGSTCMLQRGHHGYLLSFFTTT
jgi:hypothetical protein